MPTADVTFRRAPHLVSFWRGDDLVVHDPVRRVDTVVAPPLIDLLDALGRRRSLRALTALFPGSPARLIRQAVARLTRAGLVRRSDRPAPASDLALNAWTGWTPEPAFFHFSTKNARYVDWSELGRTPAPMPAPPPLKTYPGRRRIRLEPAAAIGELPSVLLQRRTWRQFGRRPISRADLSTLLGLTFGVQQWMHVPGQRRAALKTSPSGGARHSIEAYVLALRVNGLPRGLYHFQPDDHALVPLKRGATAAQAGRYLPTQPGYRGAAAIVIMTSVFARVRARYPYARSYRGILAGAGHLCQTFCLVATWLDLAPFCTMAFADSLIERDLGIDGISESAIYVAGVGSQPSGTTWAPHADPAERPPRRSPPAWRSRLK